MQYHAFSVKSRCITLTCIRAPMNGLEAHRPPAPRRYDLPRSATRFSIDKTRRRLQNHWHNSGLRVLEMKQVNIGLVGFGTVGGGLYRLLAENGELIRARAGIDARIKTVCDLDVARVKSATEGVDVTADYRTILADKEIDLVVELIGGIEPAKTIIADALRAGKHAVTANKKLLAEAGDEIFALAAAGPARLGFEAAVGGGIPCILALRQGLVGNRVLSVMGILNGTTNYILTRMREEHLSFETALADAQRKGFAEADPTFDIEGFDAGHKIAILAMLAYGMKIDYRALSIEGITKIRALDMEFAREMGYVIKLLGIAKLVDGKVDIRVHPTMLPLRHPLASVQNEFNAVMFTNDMTGPVTLHGKGAGSLPTASAVASDIVEITKGSGGDPVRFSGSAAYVGPGARLSRYYMRVHTEDRHGILSKIAGALAAHSISIASVIQKESETQHVPLIIMTHRVTEADMLAAAGEISGFDFVEGSATLIRVED
ncbi:MAG: homoserine dehydrogenase [Spirochaetes bacterium]|nr:MAG: homoserine dehydrogenase [Spirochaetota bacterium]